MTGTSYVEPPCFFQSSCQNVRTDPLLLNNRICFAAALAKVRKAELITGDPEFKQVENEIRIGWLKCFP